MNRNYLILTALMLILAVGTMFLKQDKKHKQIEPDKLLWEIIQPTRYVTTDQVAKRIIQKDPSLELVDVRSADEYNKFSLPNAINIPLDSLVNADKLTYFGITGLNVIFFSNDDIFADQAWVITKRLGFGSTYVMKGGLNKWIETIIQPEKPSEEASQEAIEIYEFRKGASLYFTGAKVETSVDKEKVVFRKTKKVSVATGGC